MVKVGDKLYDRDKRRLNWELTVSRVLFSGIIATTKNGKETSISLSRIDRYSTVPVTPMVYNPKTNNQGRPCKVPGCNKGTPKKGPKNCDGADEPINKSEIDSFIKFCEKNKFSWGIGRIGPKTSIPDKYYKFIREFDDRHPTTRKKYLSYINDVGILKNIRITSGNDKTKLFCNLQLNKVQGIKCKINGCTGGPNTYGTFSSGFCHRHHLLFLSGGINESGQKPKCKIKGCPNQMWSEGMCRSHYKSIAYKNSGRDIRQMFNSALISIAKIRANVNTISSMSGNHLKESFSELDKRLSFVNDAEFIKNHIDGISNYSVKVLLKNQDIISILNQCPSIPQKINSGHPPMENIYGPQGQDNLLDQLIDKDL